MLSIPQRSLSNARLDLDLADDPDPVVDLAQAAVQDLVGMLTGHRLLCARAHPSNVNGLQLSEKVHMEDAVIRRSCRAVPHHHPSLGHFVTFGDMTRTTPLIFARRPVLSRDLRCALPALASLALVPILGSA